jgi:hypothetical protein
MLNVYEFKYDRLMIEGNGYISLHQVEVCSFDMTRSSTHRSSYTSPTWLLHWTLVCCFREYFMNRRNTWTFWISSTLATLISSLHLPFYVHLPLSRINEPSSIFLPTWNNLTKEREGILLCCYRRTFKRIWIILWVHFWYIEEHITTITCCKVDGILYIC